MHRRLLQCRAFSTFSEELLSRVRLHPEYRIPTPFDPARKTAQDKLLFTPGPLTTSFSVRLAASRDLGSRDIEFINTVKETRSDILKAANVSPEEYSAVFMQGSGTYGVEAVLSSIVPKESSLLIIANGAYGLRMGQIAKIQNINHVKLTYDDNQYPDLEQIEKLLRENKSISHVAVVESETTSGIVNDVTSIGKLVKKYNKIFIVDAMSSFGAYPTSLSDANIDYLVTSSNKCVEGLPGFAIAIAKRQLLTPSHDHARALSLDVQAQWKGLELNGQFRFTPPTHSILAFHQALKELQMEGGVRARAKRYKENQKVLQQGMSKLGFELYLPVERQGYIISSYRYPSDKNFDFNKFYKSLNDKGFVIYPGKVSAADCFRIGHIGRLFPDDSRALLGAIESTIKDMRTAAFA